MTSRNWKDRREKEAFIQQLRDFHEQTVVNKDLYAQECLEAFDRYEDEDSYEDLSIPWSDPYSDWYCDWDDYYEVSDECEEDGYMYDDSFWDLSGIDGMENEVLARPGFHVRGQSGITYLVLDSWEWADLKTGAVIPGRRYVDKGDVAFGL